MGFQKRALSFFHDMTKTRVSLMGLLGLLSFHHVHCMAILVLLIGLFKLLDEKRVRLNLFVETALLDMDAKCGGGIGAAGRISDELGEYNKRFGYS